MYDCPSCNEQFEKTKRSHCPLCEIRLRLVRGHDGKTFTRHYEIYVEEEKEVAVAGSSLELVDGEGNPIAGMVWGGAKEEVDVEKKEEIAVADITHVKTDNDGAFTDIFAEQDDTLRLTGSGEQWAKATGRTIAYLTDDKQLIDRDGNLVAEADVILPVAKASVDVKDLKEADLSPTSTQMADKDISHDEAHVLMSNKGENPEVLMTRKKPREYRVTYRDVMHLTWVYCPNCLSRMFQNTIIRGSFTQNHKCRSCKASVDFVFESSFNPVVG